MAANSAFRLIERVLPYRRAVIVTVHVALVAVAYLLAFLLRFEFRLPAIQWDRFLQTLPVLLLFRLPLFGWFHLYKGLWRYVSMRDILAILKAATLSSVMFSASVLIVFPHGFPRSVFLLDWVLCLALVGGIRLALRAFRESTRKYGQVAGRRALIVGAGDAGEMLLRDIDRSLTLNYEVVAFVDDALQKQGTRLHGIEVAGTLDQLPQLCRSFEVQELLIAIPSDKAVKPVGIMGMTKRVAEGLLLALDGGPTTFLAVRFGNVLGSDGSILPLFQWQIARGGPVTVTDPEASRYFMLLSEATQLVLQAGAMGQKVQSSRFKVRGSRGKVQKKCKVQGSKSKVQGSKSKVQGSKFTVQG